MEFIGVKDSLLPGSEAATARQTQAPCSKFGTTAARPVFFVWDTAGLMTRQKNSITNGWLSPCRALERGHFGIAVQVLGGWPSEREPNAATPPQANSQNKGVDEGPDVELLRQGLDPAFLFATARLEINDRNLL